MSRPGGFSLAAQAPAGLSEREQHVLRERLLEKAGREGALPSEFSMLGGPLFRLVLFAAMAVAFGLGMGRASSEEVAYEFFAAYMLEVSLSAENLFAMYMIFKYFKVPVQYQENVLWWGLVGAIMMRGAAITVGGIAILMLRELMLAYAAVVIYSGFRLASAPPIGHGQDDDLGGNSIIRTVKFFIPVTDYYDGTKFFALKADGTPAATPLFVVLVAVELTDFVFAIDNVPALFGVAERGDVFVVWSATLFGLLGLRSAYTLVTRALPLMPYLQKATGAVLVFVGVRALADYFGVQMPSETCLLAIIVTLGASVAVSVWSADWTATVGQPDAEAATVRAAADGGGGGAAAGGWSYDGGGGGGGGGGGMNAKPLEPNVSRGHAGPAAVKPRSVAADLIGNALGDRPQDLAFKMTAQD